MQYMPWQWETFRFTESFYLFVRTATCVRGFEVCKTSKLHSTRSVLPRQGHAFHAMESSRKGDGFILFASAKRTKKQLLGRAKSCQWQVFVRRRPPKQGELRTDVSKATMFQGVGKPCDPGSNRRSIRCFCLNFRCSLCNRLCRSRYFAGNRRQ